MVWLRLTASLMKMYAGGLSDKLGQRKWLTVTGLFHLDHLKTFPVHSQCLGLGAGACAAWADRFGKGVRTAPRDAIGGR